MFVAEESGKYSYVRHVKFHRIFRTETGRTSPASSHGQDTKHGVHMNSPTPKHSVYWPLRTPNMACVLTALGNDRDRDLGAKYIPSLVIAWQNKGVSDTRHHSSLTATHPALLTGYFSGHGRNKAGSVFTSAPRPRMLPIRIDIQISQEGCLPCHASPRGKPAT